MSPKSSRLSAAQTFLAGSRLITDYYSMAESPVLSELKPVALANDDYDDEITHLKEVAHTEFRANEVSSLVNVSNLRLINVTSENVDAVFGDINASNTQGSVFQGAQRNAEQNDPLGTDNLIELARSVPKSLYITQVLKDSSSDTDCLDNARNELFKYIRTSEGYPFDARASLKKRVHTRNGNSAEYKLANGLYCLSLVPDGAEWEDLREV